MTRSAARRTAAAEAARRESEERLRLVANNVPALISYVDRHQRYRFSNRTYDDWLGIAHERMLGRTVAEVFGEDAYARMRPEIERCMAGAAVEFEFATAEGGKRRTLQVACVPHLGRESEVLGFYMLANDVTALKRAQEDLRFVAAQLQYDSQRLEFLAHHDTLTGLPNRAMFADRAREAVAHARGTARRRRFSSWTWITSSRSTTASATRSATSCSRSWRRACAPSVRGDDFVARIGGDEFCVLLQDIAEPREAAAVAQKLTHELGKPYRVGSHELSSGASIGIACVPQDGDDVNRLLRLADHAMYRAKELGRNGYQFFSGLLNDNVEAARGARRGAARRGRARGALPRLPAALRHRDAPGGWRRGAAALAPSAPWRARV